MKNYFANKMNAVRDGMKDNKGFSLVELIIVVAIMAVLMGVLAPQYLRFVESSREQADQSAGDQIASVMTIALSTQPQLDRDFEVEWQADGTLTVFEGGLTGCDYEGEVNATLGSNGVGPMASVWATDIGTVTFGVDVDTYGVPYITVDELEWAEKVPSLTYVTTTTPTP